MDSSGGWLDWWGWRDLYDGQGWQVITTPPSKKPLWKRLLAVLIFKNQFCIRILGLRSVCRIMTLQWHCDGTGLALPCRRHGIAMVLPWPFNGTVRRLPWHCRDTAVAFPWQPHGIAMALPSRCTILCPSYVPPCTILRCVAFGVVDLETFVSS